MKERTNGVGTERGREKGIRKNFNGEKKSLDVTWNWIWRYHESGKVALHTGRTKKKKTNRTVTTTSARRILLYANRWPGRLAEMGNRGGLVESTYNLEEQNTKSQSCLERGRQYTLISRASKYQPPRSSSTPLNRLYEYYEALTFLLTISMGNFS